ncbi:hypothetical protein [Photobacterium angustum]|uniref:Adenylosuccinate synthase n=1 Tax=Photobacterium angustum TaxID=661 RepID=A0ABX5GZ65_PHOAN|nr:hypothetical protein [Photobacterium angustum]PSX03942.1 adenylosuccinate synthase [Photobacterium angustum]
MKSKWTHEQLVQKAVKWCTKPFSLHGPGCHVAVPEFPTGYYGEIPDVIAYRSHTEALPGSVMCEVKVSRADFLSDSKKPHRNGQTLGVGQHRFYVAPMNMIDVNELPEGWGLVECTARGALRCTVGYPNILNVSERERIFSETLFDVDHDREMNVLIRLLSRIKNPAELNQIKRDNAKLIKQNTELNKQLEKYRATEILQLLEPDHSNC